MPDLDPILCSGNKVLACIDPDDLRYLLPELEACELVAGDILFEAGEPIDTIRFPLPGAMVSLMAQEEDGRRAEIGTVGHEGVLGLVLDPPTGTVGAGTALPYRALVQLPGSCLRIRRDRLAERASASPRLWRLLACHAESPPTLAARQLVACAALHSVRQRLATFLTLALDRLDPAAARWPTVPLSQDALAGMVAARRASVNVALAELERAGALLRQHGGVAITDRGALEAAACDCHRLIRQALGLAATGREAGE